MELIGKFALEFFIGACGYLIRKWFGEELSKYVFKPIIKRLKQYFLSPLYRWFKNHLIRTQREAAIWLHYKNKAKRQGHQHKNPMTCNDDRCKLI